MGWGQDESECKDKFSQRTDQLTDAESLTKSNFIRDGEGDDFSPRSVLWRQGPRYTQIGVKQWNGSKAYALVLRFSHSAGIKATFPTVLFPVFDWYGS